MPLSPPPPKCHPNTFINIYPTCLDIKSLCQAYPKFLLCSPQLYAIYMAHHHKLNHMLIYFANDLLEKLDI